MGNQEGHSKIDGYQKIFAQMAEGKRHKTQRGFMKLKTGTHVVVADSEKYLILYNHGDDDIIDLRVRDSAVRDNPPTRDQGTDRPGRYPTPNAQYSAVSNADWHRLEKEQAAVDLTDAIEKLNGSKDILIIADAKTLGRVRAKLSDHTKPRIIGEISKDLTHHTIPDIESIIGSS